MWKNLEIVKTRFTQSGVGIRALLPLNNEQEFQSKGERQIPYDASVPVAEAQVHFLHYYTRFCVRFITRSNQAALIPL